MSTEDFFTIKDWRDAALGDPGGPGKRLKNLLLRCSADDPAWIHLVDEREMERQLDTLKRRANGIPGGAETLSLYGVPFAVKDNIDAEGLPTTAACREFTYTPDDSAEVVRLLTEAGAVLVGKTNLDQFATGLVGTRSPWGAVPNSFDPRYISGGSSSGSASVVARGLVPFSLGTDTAGSGRVPAGFNNLVGLKPTRGLISTRGIVPACRSLDCVSVFSLVPEDAETVLDVTAVYDPTDPYSRRGLSGSEPVGREPVFAVPEHPEFFGDSRAAEAFASGLEILRKGGVRLLPYDMTPLHELAELLYQGPWVAERYAAVGAFFHEKSDIMDPTVAKIIGGALQYSAVDFFRAEYRRREILQMVEGLFGMVDLLVVPSTPTHYTIEQVRNDPFTLNSRLGIYTNFVNLADWSALVLPGPFRSDGLPAGLTFIAPPFGERRLLAWAARYRREFLWPHGASGRTGKGVRVAVAGAHLSGLPLNHQLTERGGRFLQTARSSAGYRMFRLKDTDPPKPGLIRMPGGRPQDLELWELPLTEYGGFVAGIPAPLGIGTVELEDGTSVQGFLCESRAVEGAEEISDYGGWRNYLNSRTGNKRG